MIHILNREGTRILDILSNEGDNIFWDDVHERMLKNNQETFDFSVPPDIRAVKHLRDRNRLVIPTEDGFFREFIITEHILNKDRLEVYSDASHISLTKKKPITPTSYNGETLNTIMDKVLVGTGWQRGQTEYAGTKSFTYEDYMNPFQALNRISSDFDRELVFRIEIEGNKIKGRYVDAFQKQGVWSGREIVSGKDLINVTKKVNENEVVTALIGMGPERESGDRVVVEVTDEDARQVWSSDGEHLWGKHEIESENEEMDEDAVRQYTQTELNKHIAAAVEYEVDAVDLEQILGRSHERIRIGDTTRIKDTELGIYLDSRVIAVRSPISDRSQKTFVLGDFIEYSEEDISKVKRELLAKIRKKVGRTLYNDGEQSGEINGGQNNMGDLYVGNLSSPTVPMKSEADFNLYVSDRTITGGMPPSDDNHGQGWDYPLRTLEEAIRRIPEQLNHQVKILMAYDAEIFEYVRINGIVGSGKIIIDGQGKWNTTLKDGLRFLGAQVNVEVEELTIIPQSTYEVFSTNAGKTIFRDCVFKGNQKTIENTKNGLIAYDNGNVRAENCNFYEIDNAIYVYAGGKAENINNKGNCTRYGLYARTGGIISGYGTAPVGGSANVAEVDGGLIPNKEEFIFEDATDQSETNVATTTSEWSSADSGSYTMEYNSWSESDVLQGQGYGAGPYRGCWFFGSGPSAAVTGKTIKQIRVHVKRANKSGDSGEVPVIFRAHSYESKPGGEPSLTGTSATFRFKRGEPKAVTLPSSFHSLFEDGSRKGIGVYSGSDDYCRMEGSATLEITYEG